MDTTPITRITVIGATGRVGTLVTRAALRRGLCVTALLRDTSGLSPDLDGVPGLDRVMGELDDQGAMRRALLGADAVICAAGVRYRRGHPWGGIEGRTDVVPAAVDTLLAAAAAPDRGVADRPGPSGAAARPHVVLLSAFGAGDSWAQLPLIARALIASSALRTSYTGLTRGEELLRNGPLPYTLVRAVTLTDAPGSGRSADATAQPLRGNPKISREDVAGLLLDAATASGSVAATGRVLVAATP